MRPLGGAAAPYRPPLATPLKADFVLMTEHIDLCDRDVRLI